MDSTTEEPTIRPFETEDWKVQRDAGKQLGDDAFRRGDYAEAIQHYTAALSLDDEAAVIYSNRSAAYLQSGQKSKALYDAQACVRLGLLPKGYSRLAAAEQSLGRFQDALANWKKVVEHDAANKAALKGIEDCQEAIAKMPKPEESEPEGGETDKQEGGGDEGDELDDFFNEVETAAEEVQKAKVDEAKEAEENSKLIRKHKKNLGTAKDQIDRLLQPNYKWRNLNPFYVLDIDHTATKDDISRRYKALSLLLHPDKNQGDEKAQEAYDQVLKAKAMLDDELKASHCKQLCEQGMIQGKADWEQRGKGSNETLEEFQAKAVHKIFAQVEYRRREVEQRERDYEKREQDKEEEELQKERDERKFDKSWKKEDRVEKRIGNWRDFQKKKKPKAV